MGAHLVEVQVLHDPVVLGAGDDHVGGHRPCRRPTILVRPGDAEGRGLTCQRLRVGQAQVQGVPEGVRARQASGLGCDDSLALGIDPVHRHAGQPEAREHGHEGRGRTYHPLDPTAHRHPPQDTHGERDADTGHRTQQVPRGGECHQQHAETCDHRQGRAPRHDKGEQDEGAHSSANTQLSPGYGESDPVRWDIQEASR